MSYLLPPVLIDIVVDYILDDILCPDIIEMEWSCDVMSNLRVSYLSYIYKKYPNKINTWIFHQNPCLTDDITKDLKDSYYFKMFNELYPKDKLITFNEDNSVKS